MKEYLSIIRLVWPLALGMLNNAVLQFVDRAFLARESMASLEAVLPASMLALIVMGFFQSTVAYSGTFVAQYHGAGNARGVALSYRAGIIIALASGVIAAAVVPLGRMLMPLISDNPDVVGRACSYYTIVSLGAVALCGQMAAASYFTGQGMTRLVFFVNLGGNILNMALDPLLIFYFGLGISGAAYATVFAMFVQWIVLAWCARSLEASNSVKEGRCAQEEVNLWPIVAKVLRFGVPSGAYSVLNILSFTIFVFATGKVGDVAFAVSNACFSVNWLLAAPMEGFAIGASTLVAQAQGRGDSAAARTALRRTLTLGLSVVTVLSLCVVAFYHPILSLFAPSDPAVAAEFYSLGFILVLLMAAWQVFDAADVVISGGLKGAGDTQFVMWWMVVVAFAIWLPLVWLARAFYNTMPMLWGTMVVYVIIICMGEVVRWRRGKWARIKLV